MERTTHKLAISATIRLTIHAGDRYSREVVAVTAGENYHIWCNNRQWWVDLIIPASPAGYTNGIADLFGQRMKDVKCFCLCGAYNDTDEDAFAIGMDSTATMQHSGTLSFFANDVPGYEWNNWGTIQVNVERLR